MFPLILQTDITAQISSNRIESKLFLKKRANNDLKEMSDCLEESFQLKHSELL